MKKICAIISAAGIGERFGIDIPKQFLVVNGEPIFITTLKKFIRKEIDNIILVIQPHWRITVIEWLKKCQINEEKIIIIDGGVTAEETRWKALSYIKNNNIIEEEDIVIFHDSVRPNVSEDIIKKTIEYSLIYGNATPKIINKDSLCLYSKETGMQNVFHSNLYRLQTPQAFLFNNIYMSYLDRKKWKGSPALTYSCFFNDIHTFNGEEINFKITTKDDLELFKKIKSV